MSATSGAAGGKVIPVGVEYTVHDAGASAGAKKIGGHLREAGHEAHGLGNRLKELRAETNLTLPALFGVGYGLAGWIEKAKEANAEFGKTKRAVASTLATVLDWDKGTGAVERYRRSTVLANDVVEELEATHARFGTGLEELGEVYRTVAVSGAPLKLTQKQLMDLTVQSAAAAKLYGVSGADAATRIGNALMGRVRPGGDAFNRALFQMLGNVKKLSHGKVFEGMEKGLKGLVPVADEASQGMGDHMRRIQHTVDQMFKGLSAPLFKEVASSLADVAKHMEAIGASGKPIVEEYARDLKEAFVVLADVSGTILKHWKEIAAVWVSLKAVNLGQNIAGAMAAGAGGGKGGGLVNFVKGSGVPLASAALGLVAELLYTQHREQAEVQANLESVRTALQTMRSVRTDSGFGTDAGVMRSVAEQLRAGGAKSNEEALSRLDAAAQSLGQKASIGVYAHQADILGLADKGEARSIINDLATALRSGIINVEGKESAEDADKKIKTQGASPINIAHLEMKWNFEDADPERVMSRFQEDLDKLSVTRRQSAMSHPDME